MLKKKREIFEKISKDVSLGFVYRFKKINRFTCPCCGYPTLDERAGYDICELCNWEDDGQDVEKAYKCFGGPNGSYSLAEARINFVKYKTMYTPENNTTITGGDSKQREILKNNLITTFETMLDSSSKELASLWRDAIKTESMLYKELSHSIKEYEKNNQP